MLLIQQASGLLLGEGWPPPTEVAAWVALAVLEASLLAIALLLWRLTQIMQEAVEVMRHSGHDAKIPMSHPTSVSRLVLDEPDESDSVHSSDMDESESPLRHSRDQFQQCLLGEDDVDVSRLIAACRDYAEALSVMGKFAKPMIRQVDGNLSKITTGVYHSDPNKFRSMRALLQAEVDAGRHKADAVLADPSAAMGLLWTRRALRFWSVLFSNVVRDGVLRDGANDIPVKSYGQEAYNEVLRPYNGFVSRKTFKSMVLSKMPSWSELGPKLAPRPVLEADMAGWMTTISEVLARMEALQREAGLEDLRKSI